MRRVVSLIAILVVLALSVIAVFSLTGPGADSAAVGRQIPRLGPGVFRTVAVLVGAAFAISLALVVIDGIRKRRRLSLRKSEKRNDYSLLVIFLTIAVTTVVFTVMLAFAISLLTPEELEEAGLPSMETSEEEPEEEPVEVLIEPTTTAVVGADRRDLTRTILIALGIAAICVIAILAYGYMKSVRKANVLEDEESLLELQEDIARSAEISLDRILSEPDHRMAIIAAYAHMEAAFSSHGFPRAESQTPTEYMEATLRSIERGLRNRPGRAVLPRRQLLTLTRLYEVAKFSLHELTEKDRQSALECLREVEDSAQVVANSG